MRDQRDRADHSAHRVISGAVSLPLFAYLFLWVPDTDFLLLPLLHHRSIVTHSALPALILLLFRKRFGIIPTAGGLIGLSVHLLCDALSPPVGFGQVWLPWPYKEPLGSLSPRSFSLRHDDAIIGGALD